MIFDSLLRFDTLPSTQDTAREMWLSGEIAAGAVVTAQTMTAGRGRRGRRWHSPMGSSVCLTAVASVETSQDKLWQVSLVTGLSVAQGIRDTAPDLSPVIRFPNDVTIWSRKAAGILIETAFHASRKETVALIGIGVNVKAAPLPPEVGARAIAIETALGEHCEIEPFEATILHRLAENLTRMATGDFAILLGEWQMLNDPAATRCYIIDGEPVYCRVGHVHPEGRVTLLVPDGRIRDIEFGAVVFGDD